MRRHGVLMWALVMLGLTATSRVLGASATISYQGRLSSSDGTPVADGPYGVTFSLWTDSVAGSMIWSESQTVHVSGGEGLFSCHLGGLQPLGGAILVHGDDDLFIQTGVSGETLTPRSRFGFAARAMLTSAVHTAVPGTGSLHMSVGDDTTSITASHESVAGLIDSYAHLLDDRALLGLRAHSPGGAGSSSSTVVTRDSAVTSLGVDSDGDGIYDGVIWQKVDNSDLDVQAGVDLDADGVLDVGTAFRTEVDVVAAGAPGGSSFLPKVPRSVLKSFFQSGDTPTQSQITDSVDANGAVSGTIRYNTTTQDLEGYSVRLMPDSAVVLAEASNPGGSSSSRMRVRVHDLENILKSLGLLTAARIGQSTSPESAVVTTEVTHADGSSSSSMRTRINELENILKCIGLLGTSKVTQSTTPESASVEVETQLSGALTSNRVIARSDASGATWGGEAGAKNIGLYVSSATGQCALTMTDASQGTPETTLVLDGATKRFGIGVSQPTNPIQHSSGARLTDAGDWINASDANLKENFRVVDGARLLEQLERLPIRQWNYRIESDGITHIGPTAQDFRAAFGLGEDDRSISTIDPAGVALAAVQELNRKLETENRDLRHKLDELRQQVERLAAAR